MGASERRARWEMAEGRAEGGRMRPWSRRVCKMILK